MASVKEEPGSLVQSSVAKGRAAYEQRLARIGHALRDLRGRPVLNRSPLAKPSHVEKAPKDAECETPVKDVGG